MRSKVPVCFFSPNRSFFMQVLSQIPRQGALIFLLVMTNSTAGSALIPLMGFFIVEGLGAEPWQIGFYTGTVLTLTLATNRWSGERLDQGVPVRRLLLVAILAYLTLTAILTQLESYLLLVMLVAPLMSLSNMGAGIIFTYGRLYAQKADLEVGRVNSWLRMGISLAWMVGPALSYMLVAEFGFATAFACAFVLGSLNLTLWHLVVPRHFRATPTEKKKDVHEAINWGLMIAALICLGFVVTNMLFVYAMPLYFVKETGLPASTPGLSLTVKCLTEVIVIFIAARMAEKIGARSVLILAASLAAVSMVLFAQVTTVWQALAVSILEGTYYGLFAGVSITFVQSFAPNRPGRATATYMNSLFFGGMIGSVSMGFIASATDYRTVLFVAAGSSLAALMVLLLTLKVRPVEAEPET